MLLKVLATAVTNGSGILSMLYDSEDKALYIGTGSAPDLPNGVFVYKK